MVPEIVGRTNGIKINWKWTWKNKKYVIFFLEGERYWIEQGEHIAKTFDEIAADKI